ncbi:hypothetical protein Pla52n_61240 [Stieleria varia]|uniref:Uncharacterized protein n=1 Tax=Stieleria varia TaxID=2528005 RepID=A0A5C5ZZN0_9BACT|nr:hypothetical protein Pla52n_61240 [Stieleria varia]
MNGTTSMLIVRHKLSSDMFRSSLPGTGKGRARLHQYRRYCLPDQVLHITWQIKHFK